MLKLNLPLGFSCDCFFSSVKHRLKFLYFSGNHSTVCFFYLGFLSRTFTVHRTAGEGGGHLFNSSLPLPPASQTLRH